MLLAAAALVTFSHDIAPILYRNCVVCHRSGGVAPFPLISYSDASKRAQLIATVTAKHYMPPWLPAEPHFQNERKLSGAQISMLAEWAASGAPEGNRAETPRPPEFPEGWQLGKPDLEAAMPGSFDVPADGPDLYQCFVLSPAADKDHYVRALDIRPGNPKVVHHALLFQDISGTARHRDQGHGYSCFGTPGFLPARGLGGWTPGALPFQPPPDIPELMHGHSDLVLQVHYHPTGKPESDQTRIALYFTERKPARHAADIPLGSNRIDIPPGDGAYKVTDHFVLPVDVDAIAINPHAHYVCQSMYGYAALPNGTRRTLIRIPQWNFDWQQLYVYAAPIRLPSGTTIVMEYTYNNSESNARNPNHPPQRVVWGAGSHDEMAGLHITVVPVDAADADELSDALWGKMVRATGAGGLRHK